MSRRVSTDIAEELAEAAEAECLQTGESMAGLLRAALAALLASRGRWGTRVKTGRDDESWEMT